VRRRCEPMKAVVSILAFLIFATLLPAQTNAPVRLAIISEMDEAGTVADILTAQFSSDPKIQLLERKEIERVYREQALSVGNRDYLKLGQILGADGLLLLNVNKTPIATNLTTRLIAVKPGVVLSTENFSWPLAGLADWASSFYQHQGLMLPKLTVLFFHFHSIFWGQQLQASRVVYYRLVEPPRFPKRRVPGCFSPTTFCFSSTIATVTSRECGSCPFPSLKWLSPRKSDPKKPLLTRVLPQGSCRKARRNNRIFQRNRVRESSY